jgi:membrane-associated protease RseP (regulator of RpoE activity)
MITVLVLISAVGILVWGFVKAKPYGTLGILAWLQTVVLMGPWLLFFGFSAAGIYLNLAGILLLVVSSAGAYIYLGKRLRATGQEELAQKRAAALISTANAQTTVTTKSPTSAASDEAGDRPQSSASDSTPDATLAGSSGSEASSDSATSGAQGSETGGRPLEKAAASLPPIPAKDIAIIEGIFGIDTFFRTKTVSYPEGAIFKGNLRGKPDETSQTLSRKLSEQLGDRYRSFLMLDPDEKPVVVVLPSSNGPKPTTVTQKILAVALAIATLITCLETSSLLQGFDLFQASERLSEALPIALGLTAILIAHELGHKLIANKLNVKISWPFFLPAWQLGAFGAITRFESVLPNRSVLFDVAFAGPAAGGLLSFVCLFVGLVLSHPGSLFQLPAGFFQSSILVGTLARTVLGEALQGDLVDVHPLMIVGWIGLVITAINVMPAGQLDGGRIVQAIYGRKTLVRATTVTLVLLAIVGLFNPLALYWAVLIVFLQRQPERPCMDDLSEPNDARAALALLSLFLMLLVLLPLNPSLAGRLGIG